jgi:hypothetical protein
VALNRLPLAIYLDADEFRFSREISLCVRDDIENEVTEGECASAGLPISPEIAAREEDEHLSTVDFYDQILKESFYDDDQRRKFDEEREQAIKHAKAMAMWNDEFLQFLEYYKAKILSIFAMGRFEDQGLKFPELILRNCGAQ